ncbi:hypothetical protein DFA_03867 [Cavenderia fasciculata]|uniref:Uncharacterized protein n=1 Tax=Cavenderia fasciculata TaxID=261658 RepID=F4Q0M2_CACFS|nr:uncharacterized protein DFA_03867 [Cavenderia fasciculata]EGG18373.1 hypothetical protein DFA_03867 [Cavenderia fasciculata]|eukprot:XP_004366277.1 hypothetical protein DFA_03867 [Cavenderia fasciculata]
MSLLKNAIVFGIGAVSGIYTAQNYDVPNLTKTFDKTIDQIKDLVGSKKD